MSDDLKISKLMEFSDDELIKELSGRFESFICAGRKILTIKDDMAQQKVERRRYWNGDYDVCVGLLHGAMLDCLHKNWGVKESDIDYD